MRARTRWRVENEAFNTLKNQGYEFERNYGHGKQFLSSTLAGLMMLAFLVDQIQETGLAEYSSRLEKAEVPRRHCGCRCGS